MPSSQRYGYSKGLSTAEKLTASQVAGLRALVTAGATGARSSNKNFGSFIHCKTAESLMHLGLAERVSPPYDQHGRPRIWVADRYRITNVGRAILAGREDLDRHQHEALPR